MLLKLSRFFTILFILTCFITQSLGDEYSRILYRITPPDIFGALAIGFYVMSLHWFRFSRYWYIGAFIISLFIGGVFGLNVTQSLIEVLIILFLFLLFMIILEHFGSTDGAKQLIYYFAWSGIFASLLGVYDFGAGMVGWPRIFPARTLGEVLSGFRNAGQAGAYALILLSILIPVRSSGIFDQFNKKQRLIITISTVLSLCFLFLTGKIMAHIGFVVGLAGFFILQRNRRALFLTVIAGVSFLLLYNNLDTIAPEIADRIEGKYNTRLVVAGGMESGFIRENLETAIQAFHDHPLTGSGIGAFAGIYSYYEVHSTYFKLIGEAGILGVLGYLVFMLNLLTKFKHRSQEDPWQEFVYYLVPFFFGCLVSWAYTYHMRKREFWVMMAIVTIVDMIIRSDMFGQQEKAKTEALEGLNTNFK